MRKQIKKYYDRDATVIYPPVDVKPVKKIVGNKQEFYLCLSRLVPYKRFDLAINACEKLKRKLIIAGDGPELSNLKKIAKQYTKFTGRVDNIQKSKLLSEARALIFPANEDFGIVPVEAMGQGTGVIALGKGGALESIIDGKTGVFFKEQTEESLIDAIMKFEKIKLDPVFIRNHAKKFSKERFKSEIKQFIERI
jgi:glycosyltransferase involved in cell wall biosynthesis